MTSKTRADSDTYSNQHRDSSDRDSNSDSYRNRGSDSESDSETERGAIYNVCQSPPPTLLLELSNACHLSLGTFIYKIARTHTGSFLLLLLALPTSLHCMEFRSCPDADI